MRRYTVKNACAFPVGFLALLCVGYCRAAQPSACASGVSAPCDPVAFVREAALRGAREIAVPKATYEIDTKGPVYFDLKGLNGVVIDFQGGRLNGVRRTRMFNLSGSTNVVIRNVTIDYLRLPFAQGVIEKVDAERNWDVRILAGYPCPDEGELSRLIWPVQVYDAKTLELKNPMRYPDAKIVRTGSDTYRVTGGKDRRGDVGDYCVWSIRDADGQRDALNLSACVGCRIENVTVYSTPMGCGFNEADCASTVYRNCRLVRCPESEDTVRRAFRRLRSGNHDALNARRDYVGPTLDGCDFEYHCDDCVNISGFYSVISCVDGNRIRVLPYGGVLRIDVGDSCQVLTADRTYPPDVRVAAIESGGETTSEERQQVEKWNFTHGIGHSLKRAWWLTLDRPAAFKAGSCIVSNRRTGNGFRIVNSHFGSTRARGLLIKASDGLIAGNVIEKANGAAICVTPEFAWLEGGCSTNLVIRDNVIRGNGRDIHLYDKRALRSAGR